MSKRQPIGLALVLTAGLVLAPATAQATIEEGHPELFDNFAKLGATHIGGIGWGAFKYVSPALETEIECVNLAFGSEWNEGSPLVARGQILGWRAMGDASGTGTELNRECHFKKGTAQVEAWITDEPALVQTGTLGKRGTPLTVPWNVEVRCGEREEEAAAIVKIGTPTGSTPVTGCKSEEDETAEIEKEENERKGCYASPVPAGCIKVAVLQPSLALETVFEGSLRPTWRNGSGSGLNPSRWVLEGERSGRLRLSTGFATTGTASGTTRQVGGFRAIELLQLK